MIQLPESPKHDIELRDLAGLIRRQINVILSGVVLALGMASVFLFTAEPRFTASALLQIDPGTPGLGRERDASVSSNATENALVDGEVEIIRSDAIALAVIEAFELTSHRDYRPRRNLRLLLAGAIGLRPTSLAADPTLATLERFKDRLTIRRRGLTFLVSVSAEATNAEMAADLANAVAGIYIRRQIEAANDMALAGSDLLQVQIDAAQRRMAEIERTLAVFVADNSGAGPVRDPLLKEIREGQARLADLVDLRDKAEALSKEGDWLAAALILDDAHLAGIAEREGDPAMMSEIARRQLGLLEQEIQTLIAANSEQRAKLPPLRPQDLSPELLTELFALQQEAETARRKFQQLIDRRQEIDARAGLELARARIVSPALAPTKASFPNHFLILAVALLAGMGAGLGAGFLNENLRGAVATERQLALAAATPSAVSVPDAGPELEGRISPADRIVVAPLTAFSESMRRVRAALETAHLPMSQQGPGRIVMVTSARSEEGKTTAALALARTYAVAGSRTLLIDGDLRDPSLHRHLDYVPSHGLEEYLRSGGKGAELSEFYARDPASTLALLLGRTPSEEATDRLLTGPILADMISQARQLYDVTVIDTPPLLPVVDGRYIARFCDAVVYLARSGRTTQAEVRLALQDLRQALPAAAPVIPVLSRCDQSDLAKLYRDYYREDHSAAI